MEGDLLLHVVQIPDASISIHALRVEGDFNGRAVRFAFDVFLSTPSVWRATLVAVQSDLVKQISIHALRVECAAARFRLDEKP